jgi:hypothetical protein
MKNESLASASNLVTNSVVDHKRIYLDNNSTTQIDPRVIPVMIDVMPLVCIKSDVRQRPVSMMRCS